LSATLDRDTAPVGSVIVLTLNYGLPEGARLAPGPEIKGLEELTIVDLVQERNRIRISLLVDHLEAWQTGSLSLSYLDKEGKNQLLKTGPLSLKVLSNLGDKPEEAQLRPIQGIISIKTLWLKYLPWGAGFLGILLVVGGLLWWYRRRHSQQRPLEFMDPPHVRARKDIDRLEAQRLFEKGLVKEFYFGFSEILRRYMESLRHFPAAEFTTEEIAHHADNEQDRKLLPLLRQADLIKFADVIPTPADKEEDVKTAVSYIQETSPSPENDGGMDLASARPESRGGNPDPAVTTGEETVTGRSGVSP
jgi:hypothetical protein